MLKSYGGWVVGGLQDFSVSPRTLGFGFLGLRLRGLGPGLDNTLTTTFVKGLISFEYVIIFG